MIANSGVTWLWHFGAKGICPFRTYDDLGRSYLSRGAKRGGEVAGKGRTGLVLFFLLVLNISHSNLIEPSLARAIAGPDVWSSGVCLRLVSGKLTEVPASMDP